MSRSRSLPLGVCLCIGLAAFGPPGASRAAVPDPAAPQALRTEDGPLDALLRSWTGALASLGNELPRLVRFGPILVFTKAKCPRGLDGDVPDCGPAADEICRRAGRDQGIALDHTHARTCRGHLGPAADGIVVTCRPAAWINRVLCW